MTRKIGLLFSQSGTTSIVEKGQLKACLLAIEEINSRNSSIKFEPILGDVKSDPQCAALEANRLFREKRIDVLVGCYTSATRKTVIPVLYENKGLLLYPTLYEGEERHPNIFYCGAVPNQQVEPMLSWIISHISDKFALVGSDYIYPRATNQQIKSWVQRARGTIICERYFPLGTNEFSKFFRELNRISKFTSSLVIFSTLVGTSIISFYKEYKKAHLLFPIASPITSEIENQLMGKHAAAGHFCTSGYFQSITTKMNAQFVEKYIDRFGGEPISREMATSYEAIHLLSEAYHRIHLTPHSEENETERLRSELKTLSFNGPQGKIIMDPDTQHLWQWSRIGQVMPNGEINVVWSSPGPIPPRLSPGKTMELNTAKQEIKGGQDFHSLIGKNKRFLECVKIAKIASKTSSNVLVTGKSGTGKELFAKAIHSASDRSKQPFVPINCAAIPRDLIASELFGYEEGSFTGAKKGGRPGKFELAHRGTLFLDEIGEMPIELQGHLLRVLEENEVYRIGGTKPICLDARIISATCRDLPQEIAYNGTFRGDLYYRLNVFNIDLPLLRERLEDVPLLADCFLNGFNRINNKEKKFSAETLNILTKYTWPGNVRQLANAIERSFYVATDSEIIYPIHLPNYLIENQSRTIDTAVNDVSQERDPFQGERAPQPNGRLTSSKSETHRLTISLKENEEQLIKKTIEKSGYNISKASKILGIARCTMYRKIKKYNIITKQN